MKETEAVAILCTEPGTLKQTGYSPNGGSILELTGVFTLTMSPFISSGAYSLNPLASFLTKMCQIWEFCAARCSVSRVLLVQGKATVAAVILLIFLIWANVGGEVKQ